VTSAPLIHLLLALAAVILLGRLLGLLLSKLHQPPVIGEVLAGIALGPLLLGWIGTSWLDWESPQLLPAQAAQHLGVIAQLGIILYMFLVGVEFNVDTFRGLARSAAMISAAGVVVPFALGMVLAQSLSDPQLKLIPSGAAPLSFALFMGVAMAVTAFPVLARILTDRGIAQTDLGVLALSCAAVDDVTAWCLLALVAGVVQAQVSSAAIVAVLSLVYIALMLLVVRPLAGWLIRKTDHHELGPTAIALIFGALLLSALTTEWIGIHAVFGAFLLGVAIPHDSQIARSLKSGLEQVVLVLLLPAFFAYTGMRTEIGLVSGWHNWLICGLIILVASLGKYGDSLAAARACGFDWRTSSALGILMNTRGLMELIVLNIGYDLGVITPTLFAMLVVMALVTTLATTPLLALVQTQPISKPAVAALGRPSG